MPITITTKRDGFWRAGVQHFGVKTYPDGYFTDEQIKLLVAEPLLLVHAHAEKPPENEQEAAGGPEKENAAKNTPEPEKGRETPQEAAGKGKKGAGKKG